MSDIAIQRPDFCPWLPVPDKRLDANVTRRHGGAKGAEYYRDALSYSQSLWLHGKPAQAILQLNKAWMAEIPDGEIPPPYRALVWMISRSSGGRAGFIGNPVRHFQHLASRMSGPRAEIRSVRAWVCMHLAERLCGNAFSRDGEQIAREGLWIPGWERSLADLYKTGWEMEGKEAERAMVEISKGSC